MSGRFIHTLNVHETALYFFLVLVGDHRGLSYYADQTICKTLSMEYERLYRSRITLMEKSLIAYEPPLYQVLELPAFPVQQDHVPASRRGMAVIGDIFNRMAAGRRREHG